jgi:hypothetical protein
MRVIAEQQRKPLPSILPSAETGPVCRRCSSRHAPSCKATSRGEPCFTLTGAFLRTCAHPSYTTYVINDAGATYANAYFEINYVNIYSTAQAEPPSLAGPAAGSGSSTTQSASSTSTGRTSGPTTTMSGGASASGAGASATPSGGAGRTAQSNGLAWTGLAILGVALGFGVMA